MRTTLTIDDLILQQLKEEAQRKGIPLKKMVNTVLEIGLRNLNPKEQSSDYQSPTVSMGFPPVGNLDKALQMASNLEDEEIVRKLELRK